MKKQLLFSIFNPLLTTFFFLLTSCVSQNTIVAKNKCGAYIAPGEWKEFMCYNLGAANPKADPFTPSWEINGGYWQWGQLQMASTGPSGPGSSQVHDGPFYGWNIDAAPDGSWTEQIKTANDPCPLGYCVPTKSQWEGMIFNNNISRTGTWENFSTNYSSGLKVGNKLFLPAAGNTNGIDGALSSRGNYGKYWSCTEETVSDASWYLHFEHNDASTYRDYRTFGFSVRCIAE